MEYYRPSSIDEALALASEKEEATFFAGGTDLMVKHYKRLDEIGSIIDISRIDELKGIKKEADKVYIGSATTHQEVENSDLLAGYVPWLSKAAGEVGSPQIRSLGTLGGNIANASPAADVVPALIVLDSIVEIMDQQRKKEVLLEEIFKGPGKTSIGPKQLITNISFSLPSEDEAGSFLKIGKRKALAISVLNGAVFLKIDCQKMKFIDIRICLGSVAPIPCRIKDTEKVLKENKDITLENINKMGQFASKQVSPIDDIRGTAKYRSKVTKSLVVRLIKDALAQLGVKI